MSPYLPPHMGSIWGLPVSPDVWAGYETSGWVTFFCLDSDRVARTFAVDIGCPVVDALRNFSQNLHYQELYIHAVFQLQLHKRPKHCEWCQTLVVEHLKYAWK